MGETLISVIMGVYYQNTDTSALSKSVSSILSQTIYDIELLICDGGSSKEACLLLENMARQDSRVVLLRDSSIATDLASKLNFCLSMAKGKYIARMDDDDYSYPQRFEKQIEYLERHSDIAFAGCNVRKVCNGEIVGFRYFPENPRVSDFYFNQPYIHPTLVFREDILESVGGYSTGKHSVLCEDYDLLLRLYAKGMTGANIQEVLFDYSVSSSAKGKRKCNHRWNEAVTRYMRFKELGVLHKAWPYVVKPLAVGILPESLLSYLKKRSHFN